MPTDSTASREGKRFILIHIGALLVILFLYVFAHFVWKPQFGLSSTADDKEKKNLIHSIVRITNVGYADVLDPRGLDWFIGHEQAKPTLDLIRENNENIVKLRNETNLNVISLNNRGKYVNRPNKPRIWEITTDYNDGNYALAYKMLNEFTGNLPLNTMSILNGEDMIFDKTALALKQLELLKENNETLIYDIKPTVISSWMWISPTGSLAEVLFWSLFGVITNLLVNSAKHLNSNTYRPLEEWVGWTKLIYGPFLSLIIVMAIMFGFLDTPGYESRAYTLPLLGFIFGYNTRKIANQFDKLSERVLGSVEAGINEDRTQAIKRQQARLRGIRDSLKPRNMEELNRYLPTVIKEAAIAAAVREVVNKKK
ncbi:hypothetical protein [Cerasicoccus maritimus]|uniref:hypothetical protein n=1 Tax=Cerasicoccus maritimus TaxID=490089 RepID=UPI002852D23D|nr:hypothetical protein [Cerasicoccus maritimus]